MFDAATLSATRELVLRVEVLLNPIGREKMRMIRKWVAQNNTPEAGPNQGISMSNAIFNRILDQYADGSDIAAAWRADVPARPFDSTHFRMKAVRVGLLLTLTIFVMAALPLAAAFYLLAGRAAHQPQPRLQPADRARAR